MHTERSLLRALLVITALLLALATALIAGTRALALRTPRAAAWLAAGDCAAPCWHGFRPGDALVSQMTLHAPQAAPLYLVLPDTSDNVARRFGLIAYGTRLTVGDVVRVFGPPERVRCLNPGLSRTSAGAWQANSILYWADGLIAAETSNSSEGMRLHPGVRVVEITYYAPGPPVYPIGDSASWQGFASAARYPLCEFAH